jgi:serine/threonine protein phosphatase 1
MLMESWFENGGGPTIKGLQKIQHSDPELFQGLYEYLKDAPLYEQLEVNGKEYILVHAGLGNFSPEKAMEDYTIQELLLERPDLGTRYDNGAKVIFGHTPTEFFDPSFQGREVRTPTWICIDTGAAMGNLPMLLRLEDEKAFY